MDKDTRWCDWCGKPATTMTRRTLYANTEFEINESYCECDTCAQRSTESLRTMDAVFSNSWKQDYNKLKNHRTSLIAYFVRVIKGLFARNKNEIPF